MVSEGNNMYMPVVPQGFNNGGNDMIGGGWGWWIIILLIFAGWGNNGWGGMGNGGNVGNEVQRGFDQSAVMSGLSGIQTTLNANQTADMNQNFQLQSAFQNCCCENRMATADLKFTVATEAAATRANDDSNNQKILDKLCQLEMDGIKQNYEGQLRAMQNQLNAAAAENQSLRFAASQGAQTAQIMANNEAQTIALERYLAPTPVPAYVVQNPNCCQQNFGTCNGYAG